MRSDQLYSTVASHLRWLAASLVLVMLTSVSAMAQSILRGGIPNTLPGAVISANGSATLAGPSGGERFNCIGRQLAMPIHWAFYPTARLLRMVEKGDLDFAYPMGFSVERDKVLNHSEPVVADPDIWVYRTGKRPDLRAIYTLRVASKAGSPQAAWLEQQSYKLVSLNNDYAAMFQMLSKDYVDAILIARNLWLELNGSITIPVDTEIGTERAIGFYLSKNADAELLTRINTAIKQCNGSQPQTRSLPSASTPGRSRTTN